MILKSSKPLEVKLCERKWGISLYALLNLPFSVFTVHNVIFLFKVFPVSKNLSNEVGKKMKILYTNFGENTNF